MAFERITADPAVLGDLTAADVREATRFAAQAVEERSLPLRRTM